ncbi:MAG: hypothetical protein AABW72_05920 [archaeon]
MVKRNKKFEDSENDKESEEEFLDEEYDSKDIDENYSEEDKADESGEYIKGYNEELLTCDFCGRDIDPDQAILKEIDDEEHTFCSERCAANFKKEHRTE